ncbi:sensor domain-containing protein [Mycolicibacterium boenickei]|uniref:histidine kinase n=2 Tax=Mycolicibacterium boenickei TaxID=146017 RepID=A0AAX2ZXX7_9MYCO|nr:sensor histidine kinase [Mycolicibacterium boenickei]UNC00185.1 sensor domain-containing protein [Mycolicibacterium boenickei]BBX89903.1 histidine kinase [Mycolicibacterium boenickei]
MMTVTTTAIASASATDDWRPTLRTPFTAAAWRGYLYFLLITVLAVVGVVYLFVTGLASGLLLVTLVGIPLVALVVLSGRQWNALYRLLVRLVGVTIDAPAPFTRQASWPHTLAAALTDGVGWRSLGFLLLHSIVMTPLGYGVVLGVVISGVLVVSPAIWAITGESIVSFGEPVDSLGTYLLLSAGGLLALYLLAWVMIGVVRAHVWLAAALLAPTERERRVGELERARADVVDDSAATLRRVERDLHDGTQARLIAVAMTLARAEEQLADPDKAERARQLVSDALANTKDTLTELRDLVRGIRPPALDLGLVPAVQTLVARNPIPVELVDDVTVRPSMGVETLAYFCVAELLANVSRHSGATQATVRLHSDTEELRITVADNGSGGVEPANGSGLTGLADRLRMVDGRLDIESPAGGPTTITAVVPSGAQR